MQVLFSGFGGDQAISHNAMNVPTDLVSQQRWKELAIWFGGKRRSLKPIASRWLMTKNRELAEKIVMQRSRNLFPNSLLRRTLTSKGNEWLGYYINNSYPWEIDSYIQQHQSIRQRVLASWVTTRLEEETRLAAYYGINKVFPLLDETLISTLLQQDPAMFGEGVNRGRLVHRRAFAPFLPPYLRHNPNKEREPEGGPEKWHSEFSQKTKNEIEKISSNINNWHSSIFKYWNIEDIIREIEYIMSSKDQTIGSIIGAKRAMIFVGNQQLVALTRWLK